jgi:hypothetical protein
VLNSRQVRLEPPPAGRLAHPGPRAASRPAA